MPGRVANRICKGKFKLGGNEYTLVTNNGENHLHGGPTGFHRRTWNAQLLLDKATGSCYGVEMTRTSADGEEGYPGSVEARGARRCHPALISLPQAREQSLALRSIICNCCDV